MADNFDTDPMLTGKVPEGREPDSDKSGLDKSDAVADAGTKKKKKKKEKPVDNRTFKEKVMIEVKFFAGLIAFLLVFWTTIFGNYKIPSESMQPTLEVGDHLYVSKFAYGYSRHSVPLNLHKLPIFPKRGKIFSKVPKRGDVVVFRNQFTEMVMIKRVFAIPGDRIKVTGGRYYLNGELVERKEIKTLTYRDHKDKAPTTVISYAEQFPGEKSPHVVYEVSDRKSLDNAGEFTVPKDTVFFLGDNRDNSIDSRAPYGPHIPGTGPGFVPFDHLIGRADLIMFSLKRCKKETGYHCPGRRALTPL